MRFLRPDAASLHDNMTLALSRDARLLGSPMADGLFSGMPALALQDMGMLCVFPVVAYPAARSMLSDAIEYVSTPFRYHLDTGAFRGERGIALAFEDFSIRTDGSWTIFLPERILPVPAFPQESCWAGLDPLTGVPTVADLSKKRFAMRTGSARIGLIVRSFGHEGSSRHDIFMHHRPNQPARALIAPERMAIRLSAGADK